MKGFWWWIVGMLGIIGYPPEAQAQKQAAGRSTDQTIGRSIGHATPPVSVQDLLNRATAYHQARPIEKLYLHLDKQHYTVGETIWFKVYATVGIENYLSRVSNIAYVELIDPKDQLVSALRIPLRQGTGLGDLTLRDTLIEGTYRLRAYTNWMRNDSADYFFSENIQISNGRADNILSRSTLSEDQAYVIDLQDMQSRVLADRNVTYTISKNGRNLRTGNVKTNAMGTLRIPYRERYAGAKLSILFQNAEESLVEKIFKLPEPPEAPNRVQFFPQGGHLLEGALNRLAVKSLQPNGLGIQSRTHILTHQGDTVAIVNTNSLGMGSAPLYIQAADTLIAYTEFENGSHTTTQLPLPVKSGFAVEVNSMTDHTLFAQLTIGTEQPREEDIYFIVHHLGNIYYASKQAATKNELIFSVNKKDLPNGVLTLTFLNHRLEPVAERPFFNFQTDGVLTLRAQTDAQTYGPRQKVTLSMETGTTADSVRNAVLSASIINRSKLQQDVPETHGDIFSSLLLSNDIQGYLENPAYYFEDSVKTQDIDNLLMTQGWRTIELSTLPDSSAIGVPKFARERGLSIRGQARKLFRKAPVPHANMTLIPTHNLMGFLDTIADAEGHFAFENLFFPDSIAFIVTARDENGKNRIDLILEPDTIAEIGANRNAPGERNNINALLVDEIRNSKNYFSELASRGFMERSITIREVVITARNAQNKASEHSANLNGRGNADQVISAEELSTCATLEMCLNGRLMGVIFQNGVPYNTRTNAPMQVILDGIYIESDELALINPSDVESVEVLRNINYTTVYGSYGVNGVLVITSKVGIDALARPHTPKGIATVQPRGLHANRTFYKPVYTPDTKTLFDRDLRTTIHWEPAIVTDTDGRATIDFFTADEPGEYLITIEGLDFYGRLGRKTLVIEVR